MKKPKTPTVQRQVGELQRKDELTIDEYTKLRRMGGKGRPVRFDDPTGVYGVYPAPYKVIAEAETYGIAEDPLTRVLESRAVIKFRNRIRDDLDDAAVTDLDADLTRVSLQLMDAIDKSNKIAASKPAKTRAGGAIPDSLVKELAYRFVGVAADLARRAHGVPMYSVDDVTALVEFSLRPQERKRRLTDPSQPMKRRFAAQLIRFGYEMTERELAERVGVAHTTVQRWKKDPDFQKEIRSLPTRAQFNRQYHQLKHSSHQDKVKFLNDTFHKGMR